MLPLCQEDTSHRNLEMTPNSIKFCSFRGNSVNLTCVPKNQRKKWNFFLKQQLFGSHSNVLANTK